MTAQAKRRCANHRDALAGWQCTACNKTLCGKCTAEDLSLFYCCACEARAEQFTRPRSGLSFLSLIEQAVLYPFRQGLVRLLLLALALAAITRVVAYVETTETMPWEPTTVSSATPPVEAAQAGADVTPEKPRPLSARAQARANEARRAGAALSAVLLVLFAFGAASTRAWGSASPPAARNLALTLGASFIVWGPGLAYLVFVHDGPPDASLGRDWLAWLYVGLSLVYLPVCAATTVGFAGLTAFNPFVLFASMGRIKLRYALTLFSLAALGAVAVAVVVTLPMKLEPKIASPFVRALVVHLALGALVGVMGNLVGALAFVHGHVFGWRAEAQFVDPILEGVRADGVLKRWVEQREALDARVRQAAEARGAGDDRQAAMTVARKISQALDSRDPREALKLYQNFGAWPPDVLKEKDVLGLGLVANKHKQRDVALQFLVPLAEKHSFHAARARLALGLMYAESGDPQQAMVLYRSVVNDFPGTEYSRQADQQLARLMGSG